MIKISNTISIDDDEVDVKFIRSPGPGGQHVNKVESAVQIRFNAKKCTEIGHHMYTRLASLAGQRMTAGGVIIITANATRSQTRNREDATGRLTELLKKAAVVPKARRKTRPSLASKTRRLEGKKRKGTIKKLRGNKLMD